MNTPPGRVALLKTPRAEDPYPAAFRRAGYRPETVRVLRYVFVGPGELRDRLSRPDAYSGLVATSPRAMAAVARLDEGPTGWADAPCFVSGPETARRARALGFEPSGEDAGRAGELADRIVRADERFAEERRPLLFLTGNRRRDELPARLAEAKIPLEELIVYRSEHRETLAWPEDALDWVIFFSPSGWEAVRASGGLPGTDVRIGAIGPTTAERLRNAGLEVAAVATRPDPDALVAAVREADDRSMNLSVSST